MSILKNLSGSVDNLDFLARQVVEGFLTGLHKSPYHGFSVEFSEHRPYVSGDSFKNIDWKLFARSEKLYVKNFEEETNLRCHILLDTSSSMFFPDRNLNKIRFSTYSSAALMYLFSKQRDGFGLTYFNENIQFFSDAKSSRLHYHRLLSELEKILRIKLNKSNKTNFCGVVSEFVEKIHRRSLIIVFSDMLNFGKGGTDKLFDSLRHLKYKKNEVILFHVLDNDFEKELKFSNSPYLFEDLENKTRIKLNPVNYREKYTELFNKYQKELKSNCIKYKIDYIQASISDGFENIIQSYLVKRSKLF